ncbi:MAG: hypothetical protein NTW62_02485 [Candidatus Nomurabacteria bacterium]|nr:hypothetical protein [Candidatus Nomurabacteria bacterium]
MIVWTGLYELAQYLIGMYYSVQIAPEQFSEDGSYQWLKVRSQIDSAVWWIYIFVLIFLIFLLLRMWVKVGKQKMDEE